MKTYVTKYVASYPSEFRKVIGSEIYGTEFTYGMIRPRRDSEFYPSRSDEKIMRSDVKEAVVLINELLSQSTFKNTEHTPLLIANGAFIEDSNKYLQRVMKVYETFTDKLEDKEKFHRIYRACPPLIALETLTNSTMSYVAQYSGLKYLNSTFGNTSQSFSLVLKEALNALKRNEVHRVIVGATNCSGNYSFLMNSSVVGYSPGWRESAGVGLLEVVRSDSIPDGALCEIEDVRLGLKVPSLKEQIIERNWNQILNIGESDLIICSGAFTPRENVKDLEYCQSFVAESYSLFESYGNLGAASSLLGIIEGVEKLKTATATVHVVDRDIYGRESIIKIKKC